MYTNLRKNQITAIALPRDWVVVTIERYYLLLKDVHAFIV